MSTPELLSVCGSEMLTLRQLPHPDSDTVGGSFWLDMFKKDQYYCMLGNSRI